MLLSRAYAIPAVAIALGLASVSCARAQAPAVNALTAAEQAAGWRLLFDGETTNGWRGYRRDDFPDGWQVVDGALVRVVPGAGDIITTERFANFELSLEWRVGPGGNSGIFYRGTEEGNYIWQTAFEMQVLDDERHPDGNSELTSAGSLFGLYPAPRGISRPAGEWNAARVVANGDHVEHWLNGVRLFEFTIGSSDWNGRIAASKFASMPAFARAAEGHIGLQDHAPARGHEGPEDRIAFRNVKIRVLP